MTMTVTGRHRDEAVAIPAARYPVVSSELATGPGELVFPVYGAELRTGVRYDVEGGRASQLRAIPTAPTGATLLNTVRSVAARCVAGVTATITGKTGEPPQVTLNGQLPARGQIAATLVMQLEGVWPVAGKITLGGPTTVATIARLRQELQFLGDPVELFALRYHLAMNIRTLEMVHIQVQVGDAPGEAYISAHAVDDLIGFLFDVAGPVARYKDPVPNQQRVMAVERNATAVFEFQVPLVVP